MKLRNFLYAPADDNAAGGGGDSGSTDGTDSNFDQVELMDEAGNLQTIDVPKEGAAGVDSVGKPSGAKTTTADDAAQPDAGTVKPQANPQGLDLDALSKSIAAGVTAATQKQQQQTQPQLTEEQKVAEFYKSIKRETITAQHAEALFGEKATPESRVAVLQGMMDSMLQSAILIARNNTENYNRQLMQEMQPYVQHIEQVRNTEAVNGLFKAYPYLQNYGEIVTHVASSLSQQNADGSKKTLPQAYEEINNKVVAILQKSGIDPKASPSSGAPVQQQKTQGAPVPKAPALNTPGGSGGTSGKPNKSHIPWQR